MAVGRNPFSRLILGTYDVIFGRPRSPIEVAAQFLPGKTFRRLFKATPDRRQLVAVVARELKRTEEDLLLEISQRCEMRYVGQVPALALCDLPNGLSILELRNAGAMPLVVDGKASALACIDPVMVKALLFGQRKIDPSISLCLAPWRVISQALDISERAWLEADGMRSKRAEAEAIEMAQAVLLQIVEEAEGYGASRCKLSVRPEESGYSFVTIDGKTATGKLSSEAQAMLALALSRGRDFLRALVRTEGTTIENLMCVATADEFLVTWKAPQDQQGSNVGPASMSADLPPSVSVSEPSAVSPLVEPTKQVMIIDDNPTFVRVLRKFLEKQGLEALVAFDGKEGMRRLVDAAQVPGLIICDVHMPSMSGIDFVRALRADPRLAPVPLIILTSDEEIEIELQVLSDGADQFLRKSEDPRVLALHARRLVDSSRKKAA